MSTHGTGRLVAARYRLLDRLGAGGMGVVWRANDELLHVEVAIKQVRIGDWLPDDEREQRVARAMREARNAARLRDHPHIVTVHDVVVEDGVPWIVMEYVPARSLADVLGEDGPLTVDQVRAVGLALVDALTTAHALGIVHRDVKPANVLIAPTGRIALVDFGIAVHRDDAGLTATGVVGTPEYIAPERLSGHPATAAGDLFSLGCTLYQAVEGRSPFRRESSYAIVAAVLGEEPAPPSHAGALTDLIVALLAKDPDRRPVAGELRRRLAAGDTRVDPGRVARQLTTPVADTPFFAPAAPSTPVPPARAWAPDRPGHRPPAPSTPPPSLPSTRPDLGAGPGSPTVPVPSRRRRRSRYALLAVGAVIALVVVLSLFPSDDGDKNHGRSPSSAGTGGPQTPAGTGSTDHAGTPAPVPGVAPAGYTLHGFAPATVAAPSAWQVDVCDSDNGCHLYPNNDKNYGLSVGSPDTEPGATALQLARYDADTHQEGVSRGHHPQCGTGHLPRLSRCRRAACRLHLPAGPSNPAGTRLRSGERADRADHRAGDRRHHPEPGRGLSQRPGHPGAQPDPGLVHVVIRSGHGTLALPPPHQARPSEEPPTCPSHPSSAPPPRTSPSRPYT
jgi:serine/threonine protein kinase